MFCICELSRSIGKEYSDSDDDDNDDTNAEDDTDCVEAMLLAQLQLSMCSGHAGSQMGGVANGGHLIGLIAFARKIARVLLSLSLLCCILFLSFYLGSNYDGPVVGTAQQPSTRTTDVLLVNSPEAAISSSTFTTIDPSAVNPHKHLAKS